MVCPIDDQSNRATASEGQVLEAAGKRRFGTWDERACGCCDGIAHLGRVRHVVEVTFRVWRFVIDGRRYLPGLNYLHAYEQRTGGKEWTRE